MDAREISSEETLLEYKPHSFFHLLILSIIAGCVLAFPWRYFVFVHLLFGWAALGGITALYLYLVLRWDGKIHRGFVAGLGICLLLTGPFIWVLSQLGTEYRLLVACISLTMLAFLSPRLVRKKHARHTKHHTRRRRK